MILTIRSAAGEMRLVDGVALLQAEGLHDLNRATHTIDQATSDGTVLVGSKVQSRSVRLRVKLRRDVVAARNDIIRICAQKDMTLVLNRGASTYVMPCTAQGVSHEAQDGSKITIALYVPIPYWRAEIAKTVWIAGWSAAFEFPVEIPEEGIEFGTRTETRVVNVKNDGSVETGCIIAFSARSNVTNPAVYMAANSARYIRIITSMSAGDVVTINTARGQNAAQLTIYRAATGETGNAFSLLDTGSEFLQIAPGDNLIRYDAETGADALDVSITIDELYAGV